MCGGVGAEGEAVRGGGVAEPVEDQAGLDAGGAGPGVEGEQAVHVPGEVEDDAGTGGLPGDRGARAPGDHGHAVRAAHREGGGHVVGVARGDRTQRHAPVVGGVHRVQRAGGGREVALARDLGGQGTGQVGAEDLLGGGGGVRHGRSSVGCGLVGRGRAVPEDRHPRTHGTHRGAACPGGVTRRQCPFRVEGSPPSGLRASPEPPPSASSAPWPCPAATGERRDPAHAALSSRPPVSSVPGPRRGRGRGGKGASSGGP